MKVCVFPLRVRDNPVIDIIVQACERRKVAFIGYDWLLSDFRRYDLFHVHWPDAVVMGKGRLRAAVKLLLFLKSVLVARLRGIPILWTVHNVSSNSHYHPVLERILWRCFLPNVSTFHHLSRWSIDRFQSYRKTHVLVPHPHYKDILRPLVGKTAARASLGLPADGFVILTFGQVRPYKGFLELIEVFSQFDAPDATLLVVGRPSDPAFAASISMAAEIDGRVKLNLNFVNDEVLQWYIEACDLVALAYNNSNNSGAAILAVSIGRPLLASASGSMLELAEAAGKRWVQTYESKLSVDELETARIYCKSTDFDNPPELDLLKPARVADGLVRAYKDCIASSRKGGRQGEEGRSAPRVTRH